MRLAMLAANGGHGLAPQRFALQDAQGYTTSSCAALVDDLERWLRATLDTLSRRSDTAPAILYAHQLWPALLRYCDDAAIEIDNSARTRRA